MPDGAALDNHWDEARAATMGPAEILVYRLHLLGGDRRITNFGGGIGLASARRLLGEGACVVLSDID
jgi:rhamnose utilization protein RhaD (predicted bifunctional aldolase and dehydrogenase)